MILHKVQYKGKEYTITKRYLNQVELFDGKNVHVVWQRKNGRFQKHYCNDCQHAWEGEKIS